MWWTAVFEEQWTASLLPRTSSTALEIALDEADGDLVARDPVTLIEASRRVADVPMPWLAYLAAERSVDEFSSAWPESRQREVTAGSLAFHRVKGTRAAIERALSPFGYDLSVREWFEHLTPRPPYTFQLVVRIGAEAEWHLPDQVTLVRVANQAKNAHTLMEFLAPVRVAKKATTYVGGYRKTARMITIVQAPLPPITIRSSGFAFVGGAHSQRRTVRVRYRV